MLEKIEELEKLKEQWILSNEEFEDEKKKFLTQQKNTSSDNPFSDFDEIIKDIKEDKTFNPFSPKWRIGRWGFIWMSITIYLSFNIWIWVLFNTGLDISQESHLFKVILVIFLNVYLMLINTMKRLHDMEKSGLRAFLIFVPLANIYLGFLLFLSWSEGQNKYWYPNTINNKYSFMLLVLLMIILVIFPIL